MNDTRQHKRSAVSLRVRFKSATLDDFIEDYIDDVSLGGIFLRSDDPLPVGTLLKFQFLLRDSSPLIEGVGRVVWKRQDDVSGMGIKFIKMSDESRACLDLILRGPGEPIGGDEGPDAEDVESDDETLFPEDEEPGYDSMETRIQDMSDLAESMKDELGASAESIVELDEAGMDVAEAIRTSLDERLEDAEGAPASDDPDAERETDPSGDSEPDRETDPSEDGEAQPEDEGDQEDSTLVVTHDEALEVSTEEPTIPDEPWPEKSESAEVPKRDEAPGQPEEGTGVGQASARPNSRVRTLLWLFIVALVTLVIYRLSDHPEDEEPQMRGRTHQPSPQVPSALERSAQAEQPPLGEQTAEVPTTVVDAAGGPALEAGVGAVLQSDTESGAEDAGEPSADGGPVEDEGPVIEAGQAEGGLPSADAGPTTERGGLFGPDASIVRDASVEPEMPASPVSASVYRLNITTHPAGAAVRVGAEERTSPATFEFVDPAAVTVVRVSQPGFRASLRRVARRAFVMREGVYTRSLRVVLRSARSAAPSRGQPPAGGMTASPTGMASPPTNPF